MFRRRRPLLAAGMLGGTAYVAHKAGQQQMAEQQMEADQEARLAQLESQQQQQQWQQQPPPAAAAQDSGLVGKLQELAGLHEQGILNDEEFASAKQKLLAS